MRPNQSIYSFTIDKLSEENAGYWFHTIWKQVMAQHVWEAIEMHAEVGNEDSKPSYLGFVEAT